MMKNVIVLLLLVSVSACSSPSVKITRIDSKRINPKCIPLAKINTENQDGVEALALIDADNKVRDLKGDTLATEEIISNGKEIKFSGVAYRCKTEE